MDTSNLGRYEASWEVVPSPSKTSNLECAACSVKGVYEVAYLWPVENAVAGGVNFLLYAN